MKRVIFVLLVITIVTSAQAKYSGGSGEPNTPYQIATKADLLVLAADVNDYNKCFILTADIDLDPNLPGGQVFTAAIIASDGNFTGTFDGRNHIITNFTINGGAKLGLFGVNYGTIKNVGLENFTISGADSSYNIGGLAGDNESTGSISNCHSSGNIRGGYNSKHIGGVAGTNIGTVVDSFSAGTVSGDGHIFNVGGLVGNNFWGTISKCFSTVDVNGGSTTGGLAGISIGIITNCFSTGSVIVGPNSMEAGGLVGEVSNTGSINNCFSTGKVTGKEGVLALGGLVGMSMSGGVYISNCFSTGSVTGGAGSFDVGGFIGKITFGNISNCYSTGDVNGASGVGGFAGGGGGPISSSYFLVTSGPNNGKATPLTDAQMKQQSSFVVWDFDANWAICENLNYPRLLWSIPAADLVCPDGVNFADYSFFTPHWLNTNCAANNDCDGTDFDFSGTVDIDDLKTFCNYWLQGL